jgi:cytochrome c556
MNKMLMAATIVALGTIGLAHAQEKAVSVPPDKLIAARQSAMLMQQQLINAMERAIKAKGDIAPFKNAATAIAASTASFPALFVAGTESGHDTKAKPAVFSDQATFQKDAAAVHDDALKLAAAAGSGDQAAFGTAFQATAEACLACHREFRAR